MRFYRPCDFGEPATTATNGMGATDMCAFDGCANKRRPAEGDRWSPSYRGKKKYCHGHEKQLQLGKELAPLRNKEVRWTPYEWDAVRVLRRKGYSAWKMQKIVGLNSDLIRYMLKDTTPRIITPGDPRAKYRQWIARR